MLVVLTLLRHLLAYSPTRLAGKGEISVLPGTTSIVVHCTILTTNAAFAVLRVGCVLARVAAPGNARPRRPSQPAAGLASPAAQGARRRDQRVLPGSVGDLMNPRSDTMRSVLKRYTATSWSIAGSVFCMDYL